MLAIGHEFALPVDRLGSAGARQAEALAVIALLLEKEARLSGLLDALGDHLQPQVVRQTDYRTGDRGVLAVIRQAGDEALVDLQLVHVHALEPQQRGVAGAEVVDGHVEALTAQLVGEDCELVDVETELLTDAQLLGRARSIQRHLRAFFSQVVWGALGSSIGMGILPALIGELDPSAISKLITGIGDVDSADIANRIFRLSRLVNNSASLSDAFDLGTDHLLDRIADAAKNGDADAAAILVTMPNDARVADPEQLWIERRIVARDLVEPRGVMVGLRR